MILKDKMINTENVRENIRNGSSFSVTYLVMNTLATIIACYGLFANSPAVVIGAMIIAMLLGPISGIALALVDSDWLLLQQALLTLGGGVFGVLLTAFVLGLIHQDIPLTNEIISRTTPNLLDLMIALAGGAAGTYATASPRLSVGLVGVAISTALVPPLSSASILLGRGEYDLAFGAFLLAFTNIVAIQFASSLVLWFTGFCGVTHFGENNSWNFLKRNIISLSILAVLALTLTTNLQKVVLKQTYENKVRQVLSQEIESLRGNHLAEVRFETKSKNSLIRAVVRGPNRFTANQVGGMEVKLPQPPNGDKNELRVRFVQTMILNRDGSLYDDAEFGNP